MNLTAAALLYSLAALTLVFTLGGGALLILRRRIVPAAQMRAAWLAVLLLSMIPLRVFAPAARVTAVEDSGQKTVTIYIREAAAERSSPLPGGEATGDASAPSAAQNADGTPAPGGMTVHLQRNEAVRVRAILALFCCLWLGVAVASFIFRAADRIRAARALRAVSVPCPDARILALYRRCAGELGISSPPPLRQFFPGIRLSPCLCGLARPAVYVCDGLAAMPEDAVRMILLHELSHARARDPWLSLLAALAASLHWLNPVSAAVERALAEDCEFACDESVLRICGGEARLPYISVILDIAAMSASVRFSANLCASQDGGNNTLKRRYDHMKKANSEKHGKLSVCLCLLLTVLLLGANAAALSSCAFPQGSGGESGTVTDSDASPVVLTNPILASALAEYFGLEDVSALTTAHLSAVTSLEILPCRTLDASSAFEEYVLVAIRLNGGKLWVDGKLTEAGASLGSSGYCVETLPVLLDRARFEEICEALEAVNSRGAAMLRNFYILKDASPEAAASVAAELLIEELTANAVDRTSAVTVEAGENGKMRIVQNAVTVTELERGEYDRKIAEYSAQYVREMTAAFPFSEKRPMMLLDTTVKPREAEQLIRLIAEAGALDGRVLTDTQIDLADTALMPNLTFLAVDDSFTAVNVPAALAN